MIYNSILDTIGKTPIVRLNHIAPKHVDIYVKIEAPKARMILRRSTENVSTMVATNG